MKRFFFLLMAAVLTVNSTICRADNVDIHVLHSLSNTMEHGEFLKMAIQHDSLTRSITTQQWYDEIGIISDDTLNMFLMPTLYDLIANDYFDRRLPKRDSVLRAWRAFHAQDENILPRLYTRFVNDRYSPRDTLYALYEAEMDRWESGYILMQMNEYDDPLFHRYLLDYQEDFPNSPFAPNIRHAQKRCEQIHLLYEYKGNLRSTDSVSIEYDNVNAHEIVFELYRLPNKLDKKTGKKMVKVDSVRVTVEDDGMLIDQPDMICKMAPQPYGRYFIFARLPEDSLQKPASQLDAYLIYRNSFFVSDLRIFEVDEERFEKKRPWFVLVNTITGQPVRGAKVKKDRHMIRYTNRNGEAVFRTTAGSARSIGLQYKKDRYHHAAIWGSHGTPSQDASLKILPNACIFRPGDTLRLSIVGQGRDGYRLHLLNNAYVHVDIRNYNGYVHDTVLTMDDDATVSLCIPFTEDMKRGQYYIAANRNVSKKGEAEAYAVCTVQLEDYRLPTFGLAIDDSCCVMQRDRLKPITGKVMRTNGLPMAGATVVTKCECYVGGDDWVQKHTDTTVTDRDGVFRVILPDSIASKTLYSYIPVTSSVTAPDGETRYARRYILLRDEKPNESAVKPVLATGVPQDSLLWLPSDSMVIRGRDVTMRLGVPRDSWVYCVVSRRDQLVSHEWQQLTPGMHTYSFTLPDTPDDYLDIHFVTTGPDGEHVECHRHLPGVAQTELHIVPVTMRDYLTPDARETWTFRLTDAQGQPVQGRMVLSMTDQAIEKLRSSEWNNARFTPWQKPYTSIDIPWYYDPTRVVESHVPALQGGFRFFAPMLYEPYRVDSGRLVVVNGQVVDVNGEPLIGVSVAEQGTNHGTVSDYDGLFHMAVHPGAILECSYIGFESVTLQAYNNMYIVMQEADPETLNEVVVTGYGAPESTRIRGVGSIYGARAYKNGVPEEEDMVFLMVEHFEEEEEDVDGFVAELNKKADNPQSAAPVALREGDTRLALFLPALHTDSAGEVHVHFVTPPDNTEWFIQAFAWSSDATSDYLNRTLMARRTLMLRLQLPRFLRHGDAVSLPCVVSNTADTARQTTVTLTIRDAATDSVLLTHTEQVTVPATGSHTLFVPYAATRNTDIIVTATVQDAEGTADGEKRLLHVLPLDEPVRESVPFYMRATDSVVTLRLPQPVAAENRQVELMLCANPVAYIAAQLPADVDSSAVTVTQLIHNLYALSLRNRLAKEYPAVIAPVDLSFLVSELNKYQRTNGAFRWLKDYRCSDSEYLTLQVLTLLGEMEQAKALDSRLNFTKRQAVQYLDREMLRREKEYRKAHHDSLPDYRQFAQYAQARVMCSETQNEDTRRIVNATLDALYTHLNTKELTAWPLLALTFEHAGQHDRALALINGLRRYATMDNTYGMYWNNLPDRWWWYRQAEVQATFLLAFGVIDPQSSELDAMRQWLILNNRTTEWGKSSLNAYVTYALMQGTPMNTKVGAPVQTIALPDTTSIYTLRRETDGPMWGALMSSYEAPANQLKPFGTKAMRITRTYERADEQANAKAPLVKGDRIRVTITIKTDREMDQVIVTDRRPALLEPIGSSSFCWNEGVFYFREVRNTEDRLYIEHLKKGTNVLTYDCYVTASGTTIAGLASAASDLAPEFTTHTDTYTIQAE